MYLQIFKKIGQQMLSELQNTGTIYALLPETRLMMER